MANAKEALLFEKRSKNFCELAYAADGPTQLNRQEFFGSFFSKKNFFLFPSVLFFIIGRMRR
jgi:hypothetical protein